MSTAITALYGLALLPHAAFFGIAVYLLLAPCYDKLSGQTFIEFFQKIDPYMRIRVPLLSFAQIGLTLPLLGLTYDQWATVPFWLTAVALLMGFASMVIAIWGNVPLNRQMDRWSPADPPAGWEQMRDRWLRCHTMRGMAEITGFILLLAAALIATRFGGPSVLPGDPPAEAAADRPAPRRWEATVYLPLADNEGQPFSETTWHAALEGLVGRFGGATLGQPQEGCWLDARRRVCREQVRPVVVSFAPERLDEFRLAVHAVGKHLGQEAMYVRFEEPRVQLIAVNAAHAGGDR